MAPPHTNRMVETLPQPYRNSFHAKLEAVALPVMTSLYKSEETPKFAYFMTSGIASVTADMTDGACAEVGIWGHEGLVGAIHLLGPAKVPHNCFIQVEGTGLRMPYRELQKEYASSEPLKRLILQCVQGEALILGQLAACNRLHESEERLARWLLMVQDRIGGDIIPLTQEFLASMLGARRSTVTLAAGSLQRSGFIEYQRGHIRIVNRQLLEGAACECYRVVAGLYRNLYN
jgi:CRP-like cAMP-binding protein